MTSIQDGQANQAFEASEDDIVVPDGPEKANKKDTKKEFYPVESVDDIEDENSVCNFFGIFPLPEICSKLFLNAAWILIFLSWASTIQVQLIFFIIRKYFLLVLQFRFLQKSENNSSVPII